MAKDIVFEELPNHQGLITLNRPQVLNALTLDMCVAMAKQLKIWADNPSIEAVVIQGAGDRAFCAGGDIVSLYRHGMEKDYDYLQHFFREEYALNRLIYHYPKPYIALLDGITMGGGVGVSIHGSHRIATERLVFAMPETAIGFFPDIGATYFLSRLPHHFGIYLGLTGEKIDHHDAFYLGLVTHVVPSTHPVFETLEIAITEKFLVEKVEPKLKNLQESIKKHFCFDSIDEIFHSLENDNDHWAQETLKRLQKKSPTSLALTLQALRRGKELSFDQCMEQELQLADYFIHSKDFYEGIRAAVIDKDRNPQWSC